MAVFSPIQGTDSLLTLMKVFKNPRKIHELHHHSETLSHWRVQQREGGSLKGPSGLRMSAYASLIFVIAVCMSIHQDEFFSSLVVLANHQTLPSGPCET
jgi:hypothetical protein